MPHGSTSYIDIRDTDSIADAFAHRVAATPSKTAYREFDPQAGAWRDHTWSQVAARVERVASALRAEGLRPGDRVAIMLRNGVDWVSFDLGAYAAGLVVVPLYVEDRSDNCAYCINDAGVQVLFIGGEDHWKRMLECRSQLGGLKRIVAVKAIAQADDERVVALADWLSFPGNRESSLGPRLRGGDESARGGDESARGGDESARRGDELATIVYTSGTTGRPKGVMLSHQNMLQNMKAALSVYEAYPDDMFLSFLPLSHMFERSVGYYLTLISGSVVSFARSIPQLSEDFLQVRPTVIVSVPRIFERLHGAIQASLELASPLRKRLFELAHTVGWDLFEWRQGRGGLKPQFALWPLLKPLVADKLMARLGGRVRLCISGGAALNPSIAHTFIGLGVPICQGYGLTEAAPIVSGNRLDRNDPASIGLPIPGVEVRFGENQALQVRGPNVMLGYWNNPEATAKVKDAEGWLDTGDQAQWKDGLLYITGRIKEIIVLGNGEKVPPVDMELAIQLDPLFEQVLVLGEGRPYLSALVVLNPEQAAKAGALDEKAVLARIGAQIRAFPGYAQVRRASVIDEKWTVDNGLLTSTLKQRRAPILERYKPQVEELYKRHG